MKTKITLGRLFGLALLAVAVVVGVAVVSLLRSAEQSAERTAQVGRERVAKRVHAAVVQELDRATRALQHVDRGVRSGALSVEDETALEAGLFLEVLADEHLAEVTFTRAALDGYAPDGTATIAAAGRRQVSVVRMSDGRLVTRITRRTDPRAPFDAVERVHARDGVFADAPRAAAADARDPTEHLTFATLVLRRNRGRSIWSDLHFAEHDAMLPASERRVVLTVQRAIEDAKGVFVGVARIGLVTTDLDAIARAVKDAPDDPHVVALFATSTDEAGPPQLVARIDPSDRVESIRGELRIVSSRPPPPIAALVASPLFLQVDVEHPNGDGPIMVGQEKYLATLREISAAPGGTTGWFVAVLGPETHYTRDVRALERSFGVGFGVSLLLVVTIGALTIRAIRRGLDGAVASLERMRAFDFAPSSEGSAIREIDEVVAGLERAKTVVRAMGKYIPMELVRRLYSSNEEPTLGGKLAEVSIMFTDIEGFTTLAERLSPDTLAQRLGDYLAAMTRAIEASEGTIDKYIGDAVMAIWNAPTPVENHAEKACRAALAAMAETRALFASPAWKDLPPLVTRFGIHEATVMVGHFGAPTHLSYTALGDGVNLAARLEPLCKQYGVVLLVSETIAAHAKAAFVFRRVDRVAVKGKTSGIDVYELLGAVGDEIANLEMARKYEAAFEKYLARDFAGAAALVAGQANDDPPSAVLMARCRELAVHPAPDDWSGVFVATSK